jgi:triphosphatase
MTETELKFQIPPRQAAAVARAVATTTARRIHLVAAYADTADRRLAAAGLALRLRREGRQWVQTLKGRGDGLMARPEHEVAVSAMPAMPAFCATRHAGTPVGEQLLAQLADGAPLQVLYRTDIRRTLRLVRSGGAQIELAHDRGRIHAEGGQVEVDELEFELKAGPAAALPALALRWVQRHGLWWDVRTKSERGFRLAEGLDLVPAIHAAPSSVARGQAGPALMATLLQDTLAQVLPNAAELAARTATPEHLHQLRVGLRRLRSVLREAAPLRGEPDAVSAALALERDWAAPFGALGAARDADALAAGLWPELDRVLAAAGLPPLPQAAALSAQDPAEVVQGTAMQALLMRTLALALPPAAAASVAPPDAAALLQPLWKRVRRGSRELAAAPPEQLHRLRKRAKRLRYLLDALAPQLRHKPLQRMLALLRKALNRLGELNDLHTAEQALKALPEPSPSVWLALGWLTAHRQALLVRAQGALDELAKATPPWR